MPEIGSSSARWLILVHQLPARPSNLRVQVWRRLQQVGAAVLRNSVYVLPHTAETREDFDWVRAEITANGGQVSILEANVLDGYSEDELIEQFRRVRSADYDALIADVHTLEARLARRGGRLSRAAQQRHVRKVRERLHALTAIDYFDAPRAAEAEAAVTGIEQSLSGARAAPLPGDHVLSRRDFRRSTWLTRPRPGIDRMASAWLIRRFISSDATFVFGALPARDGQIPFDMPDVEFGHHGTDCTIETLLRRFAIDDAAAIRIGHIVHDLDLKDTRYALPDTATIGRLVKGMRDTIPNDHDLLLRGAEMIEALYRAFDETSLERPRSALRPQARSRATAARRRPRAASS